MYSYKTTRECRLCKSEDLEKVYDMGSQYVVTFVKEEEVEDWQAGKKEEPIPLSLVMCKACTFVQLGQSVDPDRLYRQFWYKSGINESMCRTLKSIVDTACARVDVREDMAVLDIGSNDGTLLGFYPDTFTKFGFDPAKNLQEEAKVVAKTPHIYAEYFSKEHKSVMTEKFKIITAIAMFYDLEEPAEFLKLIQEVMHQDGIFIVQMNYLLAMLEQKAVDNIAHEHLGYYSLRALITLVEFVGLRVIAAETNDVNGGSIKVTIAHNDNLRTEKDVQEIANLLKIEARAGLESPETYKQFGLEMTWLLEKVDNYLSACANKGLKVYLYGASTRGSTLMQLVDKGAVSFIKGVAERNPEKYGLRMVGTWLPIFDEATCRNDADVFMVLPYHFKDAILVRELKTLSKGVKFLFPLPEPVVYSGEAL